MKANEIIDIFCHWLPIQYYEKVKQVSSADLFMFERANSIPVMTDLDSRFKLMDRFPNYKQILSLVSRPLECLAGLEVSAELAKIANDASAESVEKYPNRFVGFIASLPMNNLGASLKEAERSIQELNACGVQIFTNVNGHPIDDEKYWPLFGLMANYDLPVWLHPTRGMKHPDYVNEKYSKYEIWWALGWLYETSVAMMRLVYSGTFEKYQNLKIITHHAGAFIPVAEGRLDSGMKNMGNRTPEIYNDIVRIDLKTDLISALKYFYADTATFGSKSAIECGLQFFGIGKMLFGTDMPFGPDGGGWHIKNTLHAIEKMNLKEENKVKIFSGNIRRLIKKT